MPYLINDDGTADYAEWGSDLTNMVDSGTRKLFITMVGAVRYAGVQATPVLIKVEQGYDAAEWLATGRMVPNGMITSIIREE